MRVCVFVAFGVLMASLSFAADADSIARGKYLVDEVAKCTACHTQRGSDGMPDAAKYLKGATLEFQPTAEIKGWHKASPDITSTSRLWARWGDDGSVKFFETGANPRGNPAGPPMPAYKLSHADAQAVVDYLKSLK
jgi:mono/diheme cytochrome c family protein